MPTESALPPHGTSPDRDGVRMAGAARSVLEFCMTHRIDGRDRIIAQLGRTSAPDRGCNGDGPPDGRFAGAILAAGRGSRMGPFGERYPKAILPICNKPLIQYQIEMMRSLGVTDIVILVGHRGYEIARVLGSGERLGVSLRYVEQTAPLGIAHAVGRLEPHLDR